MHDGTIEDNDAKVSELFGIFFSNAVSNLDIDYGLITHTISNEFDPILNAIDKYKTHPSVIKIREHMTDKHTFTFSHACIQEMIHEIENLNRNKASPIASIPAKLIKENCDIFAEKLLIDFNHSIDKGTFPNNMKYADVSPIFKKGYRLDISNYRPISILSPLSKIFEKLLFAQIYRFVEPKFSMYPCGFRKNMNAQNCLLFLIEKLRFNLDNYLKASPDLSSVFETLFGVFFQ